jgi:glutamate/tyrosine decarboxylase-like PLP-dependent enzyme
VNLDLSPEEFSRCGRDAVQAIADYIGSLPGQRVYPAVTGEQIRSQFLRDLPLEPGNFDELLQTFSNTILKFSRHNAHPRMFGYVQSPGTGIAAIADMLASALNANLTAWRSAPVAVEIERLTIDWIKQIVGYDRSAGGLFVSGGSMANLAGLAAARQARGPSELLEQGLSAAGARLRVYASAETHYSVEKAAALLGIGAANLRKIPVDDAHRIRPKALKQAIEQDRRSGHVPICVVANAGTVMTGAIDPLHALHDIAREFNLWLHVDGAYGGFALLAESVRSQFRGIELADSIALDPHKWLYLPIDCGCVLYRDPGNAQAAFVQQAEYTRVIGHKAEEAFAFWDYGPELSRRFRALKVWMLLKGVGLKALSSAIEENLACARYLQELVQAADDFEMLAPVELSIFCFRHLPPSARALNAAADDTALDQWNERLLLGLQQDGSSYLSNARVHGRFSLRGCVLNYRTTRRDMEILLDDIRRVAQLANA